MAVGWGICPYKVAGVAPDQYRYCAIDDFTPQILADGGSWAEAECLGNHAVVKVRASLATLLLIDGTPGFVRIPRRTALSESLSDLTASEKTTIQNKLNALGYSNAEILAKLGGDLALITLGDLVRFVISRWRKPVSLVDGIVSFSSTDWPSGAPRRIESVDGAVA